MKFLASLTALLIFSSVPARAEYYEFCRSTYCNPYYWLWYPRTPPGLGYGKTVKLNPGGEWINRDGEKVWAKQGTKHATVLSQHNPDERNGELAYQTAYHSFLDGKEDGTNRVEQVSEGRWIKKITTGDGIVLFKDAGGNVAVQSPDGKWHVTTSRGDYAQTSLDLGQKEIVARSETIRPREIKKESVALVVVPKGEKKKLVVKKAVKKGRSLASVKPESKPKMAKAENAAAPEKKDEAKLDDIKELLKPAAPKIAEKTNPPAAVLAAPAKTSP